MTLSMERARSRKPITWLTLLGLLLLPAAVGGILVAALENPTQRLDLMTAAIVNLDEPVTINDQYTPLGRQLASGLVEGSDELDSNLSWVISNEKNAAEGLSDGTYQAVITIPENFSKSATSAGVAIAEGGGTAEQAKITVTTPPDGRVADDLITNQIATVAASSMGTMLSEATLDNVLVGFNTIGDQIGEAATGAGLLATGARDAATGAVAIPDGATQLATGAGALGSGASDLAAGLDLIAAKSRDAAAGASTLGSGLNAGADALASPNGDLQKLAGAASVAADRSATTANAVGGAAQELGALAAQCADSGASAEFCGSLAATAGKVGGAVQPAMEASGYTSNIAGGLAGLPAALSGQLRDAAAGATAIGDGVTQLAGGVDQSAAGARALRDGANQISGGATELAAGASTLATGLDTLATGTSDLAGGLDTAAASLPRFSEEESTSISTAIANPVTTNGAVGAMFGPTAIPLLAAVVLWFGALASFIALRAVSAQTLTSRRSSGALSLRAFAPAAALGAGQGILVAIIVQLVAKYDVATWFAFAGTAVLAAVAFAAVNQALVVVLGGIGRWISALIGVLAVATGLISTIPAWLADLGAAIPTAPAVSGLVAASGSAAASLLVWAVLSIAVTTITVALRRTTSAKRVLLAA